MNCVDENPEVMYLVFPRRDGDAVLLKPFPGTIYKIICTTDAGEGIYYAEPLQYIGVHIPVVKVSDGKFTVTILFIPTTIKVTKKKPLFKLRKLFWETSMTGHQRGSRGMRRKIVAVSVLGIDTIYVETSTSMSGAPEYFEFRLSNRTDKEIYDAIEKYVNTLYPNNASIVVEHVHPTGERPVIQFYDEECFKSFLAYITLLTSTPISVDDALKCIESLPPAIIDTVSLSLKEIVEKHPDIEEDADIVYTPVQNIGINMLRSCHV